MKSYKAAWKAGSNSHFGAAAALMWQRRFKTSKCELLESETSRTSRVSTNKFDGGLAGLELCLAPGIHDGSRKNRAGDR